MSNISMLLKKLMVLTFSAFGISGLFKLIAASNRFAKKDIYDLDLITDHIGLAYLLQALEEKLTQYNDACHKCLFDLDHQQNPLDNISVPLVFDDADYKASDARHTHSTDRLDILENGKTWLAAKLSWKRKIKGLADF